MATRESHEASRREEGREHDAPRASRRERERDTHGRRPRSSSRSRRDGPSPRRRREDRRRHESDRSHYHRSRAEESAKAGDRDQTRDKPLQDAATQQDDPSRAEAKSLDDARNSSPARHDRSPRGTKRFPESRDAKHPRSFFQHDERGSAGQGGRRYYRQASDRGRQRDEKEHFADRERNKDEGKVRRYEQQNDGDSTWKHDGFFQMEEEAHPAKRRPPPFNEMGMPLEGKESATAVTEPDSGSHKHDQDGPTSAVGEERRDYHPRGFDRHGGPFVRPDGRGMRRGFSDHRNAGQRNAYDSWGRFAGRGRGRERFNNSYDGRNSMHQAVGDQAEKWKHDLYDQTNRSPTPKTEEEQIAKIEALLAL
ncbi:vicilin-like seed storage protein At2g18540 [Oryza brachyantha]|uniref:Btz domain-containing protein n=1 Tax=Oryza brachyantha TaxID=4533 RepID=J3LL45_ORYBR|nr:vicilin-like seed storage protein At2g18540 [Oryza brachyantha]